MKIGRFSKVSLIKLGIKVGLMMLLLPVLTGCSPRQNEGAVVVVLEPHSGCWPFVLDLDTMEI